MSYIENVGSIASEYVFPNHISPYEKDFDYFFYPFIFYIRSLFCGEKKALKEWKLILSRNFPKFETTPDDQRVFFGVSGIKDYDCNCHKNKAGDHLTISFINRRNRKDVQFITCELPSPLTSFNRMDLMLNDFGCLSIGMPRLKMPKPGLFPCFYESWSQEIPDATRTFFQIKKSMDQLASAVDSNCSREDRIKCEIIYPGAIFNINQQMFLTKDEMQLEKGIGSSSADLKACMKPSKKARKPIHITDQEYVDLSYSKDAEEYMKQRVTKANEDYERERLRLKTKYFNTGSAYDDTMTSREDLELNSDIDDSFKV